MEDDDNRRTDLTIQCQVLPLLGIPHVRRNAAECILTEVGRVIIGFTLAPRIVGSVFLVSREGYLGNILSEGAFEMILALITMEPCNGVWIFFAIQRRVFSVFHSDIADLLEANCTNRLTDLGIGVSWSNYWGASGWNLNLRCIILDWLWAPEKLNE